MSQTSTLHPQALSRLYLHAVMPCLAELVHSVPEAREEARKIQGTIQMRIADGPSVALHFQDGSVVAKLVQVPSPLIDLVFIGDSHLNSYCSGNKWKIPLLTRGIFRTQQLKAFSRLSDLLEWYMKPTAESLQDSEYRRIYTRLTFTVMARGLPPLAQFDSLVQREVASLPKGLAHFTIETEGLSLWIELLAHDALSDLGWPPRLAEVELDFGSLETAFAAMQNQLDAQAALGEGRMTMKGLIPLADGLNVLLDRMRDYLEPV